MIYLRLDSFAVCSSDFISHFGNILKEMRIKNQLSIVELAHEIGCSRQHIYDVERSVTSPTIQIVTKWISATNPSLIDILKLMVPHNYFEYMNKKDEK